MINNNPVSISEDDLSLEIMRFNMRRWKPFAMVVIGIELLLLISTTIFHSSDSDFKFRYYAFMYALMILVTVLAWVSASILERKLTDDLSIAKKINNITITYLTFFMVWGVIVSLLDQNLYGNIMVFMINILVGSYMFLVNGNQILIPQIISIMLLMFTLPVFQPSTNLLLGHYINGLICFVFSLIIARTNYSNYVQAFSNQRNIEDQTALLALINDQLLLEIKSREKIQKELEVANDQLILISSEDALTGIANRRKLEKSLTEYWSDVVTQHSSIAIIMIDIDLFKLYNDTYGHLAGDKCLQSVAQVMKGCLRGPQDFIARYGGEEFIFLAAHISRDESLKLGEMIRLGVESLYLKHENSSVGPFVTVSVGISWTSPADTDLAVDSIGRADQAMYEAKRAGRNQVKIF